MFIKDGDFENLNDYMYIDYDYVICYIIIDVDIFWDLFR